MRERKVGWAVQVVVTVTVMVIVTEIKAKPTTGDPTHQPAEANHVEDHYLDDALGDWLDNFGTYTFMVKQDLDTHAGDTDEGEEGAEENEVEGEEDVDAAVNEVEEEELMEREEEWSAPIAVSAGSKSLLDPRRDYLVTVESLVAEEGSVFLTLSKYENQTTCGVGGLTLEEEVRQAGTGGGAGAGRGGNRGASDHHHHHHHHHSTFIALGVQQEGNVTTTDVSKWISVSEQFFWASGQLDGGGMLSITFTPPECGCLALSTYYALPVGNLTLVVGPQAYPEELQILLCIDPLADVTDDVYSDEGLEEEEEEGEEEEDVDYLQQPSALVATRNPGEAETETEGNTSTEQPAGVTSRRRKMSREEKKMAKKTKRQMKRQRIRQAGRRQARQQGQAVGRRTGRRWNRKKNQRRRTRAWKKLKKRGKNGRRKNSEGKHHHHHHHYHEDDDGVNGTTTTTTTTSDDNVTQHHHQHHAAQEERLVDILLRDFAPGNTTEEGAEGSEGDASIATEEVVLEEEEQQEGQESQTPKQRRKNRRQRKKMMRKQRRKAYPPGVKFCCKQGVKHKKNILELGSESVPSGDSPGPCDASISVVSTFANHQFNIAEATCTTTFMTCCARFDAEMWAGIKAKKEARKTERKQRRKSRRQDRKQRRKQERRLRKEMRRQSRTHHHHHHQQEQQEEEEEECTGEGCGHAN